MATDMPYLDDLAKALDDAANELLGIPNNAVSVQQVSANAHAAGEALKRAVGAIRNFKADLEETI